MTNISILVPTSNRLLERAAPKARVSHAGDGVRDQLTSPTAAQEAGA
jgi:hypothetical protein